MSEAELRNTYNTIAQDYHSDHKDDSWDNDYLEKFCEELTPGARVLDLGCGPGVDTKKLSHRHFELYGFDLSQELLEIAKKQTPSANFLQGSMLESLPYEDSYFDGIFAKASLLHIPKEKIDFVLNEIERVLKANGIIHIAVKKGDGEKVIVEKDYGYEYERFFSFWQPDELHNLFHRHGMGIIAEDSWQNTGHGTIWLKYILKKKA